MESLWFLPFWLCILERCRVDTCTWHGLLRTPVYWSLYDPKIPMLASAFNVPSMNSLTTKQNPLYLLLHSYRFYTFLSVAGKLSSGSHSAVWLAFCHHNPMLPLPIEQLRICLIGEYDFTALFICPMAVPQMNINLAHLSAVVRGGLHICLLCILYIFQSAPNWHGWKYNRWVEVIWRGFQQ